MFVIYCGSGGQRIRWLADVAVHRYDHLFAIDPGMAKGVRFENGVMLNLDDIINQQLAEDAHVWIMLKGIHILYINIYINIYIYIYIQSSS